jgi:hypothetical protein
LIQLLPLVRKFLRKPLVRKAQAFVRAFSTPLTKCVKPELKTQIVLKIFGRGVDSPPSLF